MEEEKKEDGQQAISHALNQIFLFVEEYDCRNSIIARNGLALQIRNLMNVLQPYVSSKQKEFKLTVRVSVIRNGLRHFFAYVTGEALVNFVEAQLSHAAWKDLASRSSELGYDFLDTSNLGQQLLPFANSQFETSAGKEAYIRQGHNAEKFNFFAFQQLKTMIFATESYQKNNENVFLLAANFAAETYSDLVDSLSCFPQIAQESVKRNTLENQYVELRSSFIKKNKQGHEGYLLTFDILREATEIFKLTDLQFFVSTSAAAYAKQKTKIEQDLAILPSLIEQEEVAAQVAAKAKGGLNNTLDQVEVAKKAEADVKKAKAIADEAAKEAKAVADAVLLAAAKKRLLALYDESSTPIKKAAASLTPIVAQSPLSNAGVAESQNDASAASQGQSSLGSSYSSS